eukprot:474278-Prorocentrum_lima.AAC.1
MEVLRKSLRSSQSAPPLNTSMLHVNTPRLVVLRQVVQLGRVLVERPNHRDLLDVKFLAEGHPCK